ncbi:MAG: hypothetical protein R3A46_04170 [Thermomicrobiales bacterium]
MPAGSRGSGVESRLLDLLEYQAILGAVITTVDGLLVANAATNVPDAEHLAATAVVVDRPGEDGPNYWDVVSEFGAIHVVSGSDLRLIVLTEPGIDARRIRPTLTEHLLDIEHMIRV